MTHPITVQDVLNAYEKIGFDPVREEFIDGNSCCALSAICMANGWQDQEWLAAHYDGADGNDYIEEHLAEELGVSVAWVKGFMWGFDRTSHRTFVQTKEDVETVLPSFYHFRGFPHDKDAALLGIEVAEALFTDYVEDEDND